MFNWLKKFFASFLPKPPIREGTVVRKEYQPPAQAALLYYFEGVPVYSPAVHEAWRIIFVNDNGEGRAVWVSKACYEKYEVGDHIEFDN